MDIPIEIDATIYSATVKNIQPVRKSETKISELAAEYDKTSGEPLTVLIVGGAATMFQFDSKNRCS